MDNLRACFLCGDWPDVSYELEGVHWCGPCAPWSRAPCPLKPLVEFGASVLARLERDGLRAAHGDAARLLAWLETAAVAWPGRDPWRTVRLATRVQGRLYALAWWLRTAPQAVPTLGGGAARLGPLPARANYEHG